MAFIYHLQVLSCLYSPYFDEFLRIHTTIANLTFAFQARFAKQRCIASNIRLICFANFPFFMFQSYIPGTMYYTGFTMIFDCSKSAAFQLYPPNFILGKIHFAFFKFPISDFFKFGG